MPWPGQTDPAPVLSQVIALRLLNPACYLKTQVPSECVSYMTLDQSWLMSGHFEEQTNKLASVCTCPCRYTLKLLNSWFFFFFLCHSKQWIWNVKHHHGTKKSSTKRTGKTMQIKWDFFPPTPINCHASAIAGIDVNSFWKANLVVCSHLLFCSLFCYFNMFLFLLRITWILIFPKCEQEILAIGTETTREPVKFSIFFHKIKDPGKLCIRFHT